MIANRSLDTQYNEAAAVAAATAAATAAVASAILSQHCCHIYIFLLLVAILLFGSFVLCFTRARVHAWVACVRFEYTLNNLVANSYNHLNQ